MEIRNHCSRCDGSGVDSSPCVRHDGDGNEMPYDEICTSCGGLGYHPVDIHEDDGIFAAYQILDATDISEYGALPDDDKATFNLLVTHTKPHGSDEFDATNDQFDPQATKHSTGLWSHPIRRCSLRTTCRRGPYIHDRFRSRPRCAHHCSAGGW